MRIFALAAAVLALSSCGSQESPSAESENLAVAPGGDAVESSNASGPPGPSASDSGDPVPPPDAVSHPEGYLPPAPAEPGAPGANSSGQDPSPPATEDEYLHNRQAGR